MVPGDSAGLSAFIKKKKQKLTLQVNDTIYLEFLKEVHAASLLNLVNANRSYLKEWLPWVDQMKTLENAEKYIADCNKRAAANTDYAYAIISEKEMLGRIGLHYINPQNRIAEIGYWLSDELQGRGIVTKCCKALINHGFTELGLNRIEIKCAVGNAKSFSIAEKLKFKREGILHKAELLNGKFIDLYLYAMLKEEWDKSNQ